MSPLHYFMEKILRSWVKKTYPQKADNSWDEAIRTLELHGPKPCALPNLATSQDIMCRVCSFNHTHLLWIS